MRGYTTKEKASNNRRGSRCAGHYGVASRAGHRISVGTIRKRPLTEIGLFRGDKTLRTPAFRAFVDMVCEARLLFLDARKSHLPTAFDGGGVLGERLRSGLRFHEPLSPKAWQGSMRGRPHLSSWPNSLPVFRLTRCILVQAGQAVASYSFSEISGSSSKWCWTLKPVAGHLKTKWAICQNMTALRRGVLI